MRRLLKLVLPAIFFLICKPTGAQVFLHPNQAMKSPETIVINRIETTNGFSTFSLSIENRIKDGYFCADRNIFLVYPDGTRSKLLKAEGVEVCPDYHRFREPGEKLDFRFVFPAIKENTPWVDLIEECSSGCTFFYGITLDSELNRRLDELFIKAEKVSPEASIGLFKSMIDELDSKNLGIEGLLYINIINASLEAGDKVGASVWYRRMLTSGAPRLGYYIKFLSDKGVKF
ncbi:MAG TPA: hypothetical protein VMT63_10150 [Bacteroidales bacterium]|nr:hypothetical protein [Bacteroidales bacterium]